jgi:hypothetical protein
MKEEIDVLIYFYFKMRIIKHLIKQRSRRQVSAVFDSESIKINANSIDPRALWGSNCKQSINSRLSMLKSSTGGP